MIVPFDYLGRSADFNDDGHVDSNEAGLLYMMMEQEELEALANNRYSNGHPIICSDSDFEV